MLDKLKSFYTHLNPRERILFFSACGAFILMLLDLLVFNPVLSHMKILDSEIEGMSQSIQRDLRVISFKNRILHEYFQFEPYLDTGARTQEEIISSLLKKLENLATRNAVKITNVTPGMIEEKPIYKIYKTSFDFEGSLAQVLVFMSLLEGFDNLFQVNQFSIQPKSKSNPDLMRCPLEVSRILITAEDGIDLPHAVDDEAAPASAQGAQRPDFTTADAGSSDRFDLIVEQEIN